MDFVLNKGDQIGIISPSNNLNLDVFDSIEFQKILRNLELKFGIKFVVGRNIRLKVSGTNPQKRAEDINTFFEDSNVKMIWLFSGGAFSNEILPYLNYSLIKKNPKILCGFSDATALNNAIYVKSGIVSFSGVMMWRLPLNIYGNKRSFQWLYDIIFRGMTSFDLKNIKTYYDVSIDNVKHIKNDGGIEVLKHGKSSGIIVGGNISTLSLLIGTPYSLDLKGKILFLEECSEFSIGIIRRQLMHLKYIKNFDKVKGIVFGRIQQGCFRDYDVDLKQTILDFVGNLRIPIIINACFGHISPVQTYPIGGICKIDTKNSKYNIYLK